MEKNIRLAFGEIKAARLTTGMMMPPQHAAGSIYAVWLQRYQLPIEFADERIRAVNIRGSDARALQVRDGEAGMLVTSVGYFGWILDRSQTAMV